MKAIGMFTNEFRLLLRSGFTRVMVVLTGTGPLVWAARRRCR